ncbi:MAG: glutathione peroxidase [Candidatus Omnitrophica bacterium CG11_big_fil_rev_8_21_14_0_20_64_10]|nr:MAG: glutathione peroxidase [Candidatus Omnitrophica bacterium CG11_big_fil_rev_8_21_14_0_20_64_10]
MKTIEGREQKLSDYRGHVLLVVNVASKCGFTPQYQGLEALYRKYRERGLVVLGFPANNFMGQEPGSDSEIQSFCQARFGVTFPLFSKISVKGTQIHPLYKYLTETAQPTGPISWNFNKFLIGRDGRITARWGSRTAPESKELIQQLEETLS